MTNHEELEEAERSILPTLSFEDAKTATHPLHLLDQFLLNRQDKCEETLLRATDFLVGSVMLDGALSVLDDAAFRQVCSAHRSVYLVRSNSSTTKKKARTSYYYCQLADAFTYCSCRSFSERAKTATSNNSQHLVLCKHLLALKLMPHLGISCPKEDVSVEDFGTIVMLRAFRD